MEQVIDFIKSKKKWLIICLVAIIALTVIIVVASKQAAYERRFSLLFTTEMSDVDFIALRNSRGLKKDILARIKSTNNPDEIVCCVYNFNKHAYHWDDEDRRVKNAIISQIKTIVQNLSIEKELIFYAKLEDTYFVKNPIYGNINDIITQSALESKIEKSMIKTQLDDWSIESRDSNYAIIGGTPGDLDITLIQGGKLYANYCGDRIGMTYVDHTEQIDFCRALQSLSKKHVTGGVYYNPSSSTSPFPVAVVFSQGENAYESTTIFTNYGDIRFSLG